LYPSVTHGLADSRSGTRYLNKQPLPIIILTLELADDTMNERHKVGQDDVLRASDAVSRIDSLGARLVRLEQSLDELIESHRLLIDAIKTKQEKKKKDVPAPDTKYFDFLLYLEKNFGSSGFTSVEVPKRSRHILSILSTQYNSLEVVSKCGRTNVYKISDAARKKLAQYL